MFEKMNQRLVIGIVGVILVLFFGIKAVGLFGRMANSQTEEAKYITVKDKLTIKGIAVRNEENIYKNGDGFVVYYYPNGEKLSANQEVAGIYKDESDILSSDRAHDLTKEIELLNEAVSPGNSSGAYIETITKKLTDDISLYSGQVNKHQLGDISDVKSEITFLLNSRNIATGRDIDYGDTIAKLTYERDNLEGNMSKVLPDIVAPSSGYFVNSVDGHENLNLNSIESMDATTLSEIIDSGNVDSKPSSGVIGKIIKGYDWYFASVVPNDYLKRIHKGSTYEMNFVFDKTYVVPGEVVEIKTRQGEDESIVIFECNEMNAKFSELRVKSVDIIFEEIKGLSVPKSSLRMPDGIIGVSVVFGETLVFKEVNIIYETDEYYIAEINDNIQLVGKYLQLNDLIIVPGNTA